MSSRTRLYLQKWRWYERNSLPWRRARIHLHMLRAEAFIRFPIQGNVLEGFTSKGPTSIGSNCWFGLNCVVTSGVTIGDRCVIGANSVVTRDVPAGAIAAGAPARVIREIEFAPRAAE